MRAKSLLLSDLVIARADRLRDHGLEVVTPREHHRRGFRVSLRHEHAYELSRALIDGGVIGDLRAPDMLRLGLTPLYLRLCLAWLQRSITSRRSTR